MHRSRNSAPIIAVALRVACALALGVASAAFAQDDASPRVTAAADGPPMGKPGTTPEQAADLSPLGVALESLFGDASSDAWTPLDWRDLLTEGWNTPFVFSPPSEFGALRQEWLNADNGVFYRQWVLDYAYRNQVGTLGNHQLGSWFIFAPLSRRFELLVTVPFLDYHRREGGAARSASGPPRSRSVGYRGDFGDFSVTPQVLIHETRNTSIMSLMTIRTPTGDLREGYGRTALNPQLQFWQGLPRRWVVRGGFGPTIPLSATGLRTTFDGNLTVGKFLTMEEVRYFKEFTVYLSANVSTSLDDRAPNATSLTLLPGLRFRLTPSYWFLYGVELPCVHPTNENYTMFFRLVKRY